jgi:hypothetical protein
MMLGNAESWSNVSIYCCAIACLNSSTALNMYIAVGRIASSGMLRHVALVRTDVSEELSASYIRVTRIDELGTTLAVTSNQRMLRSVRQLLVTASIVPSSLILVTLMNYEQC